MMSMLDRLIDILHRYYNQFMTWYNSGSEYTQITVLVISGVVILFVFALFFLSRITR
jgi:hypothetical protein